MPDYIVGSERFSAADSKKTQVFYATHSMEGGEWKRSSLMNRSFISFTYGGKPIEDFELIASIQNDRMQRNIYASFEDSTTNYETIDGQFYWGTHFLNNEITFLLATDGITEAELNKFKSWFRPGQNKELVLAENPNRGILARVASVPIYSLLPFQEPTKITFEGINYETSTTLYKGEITLSFIMDEPFWYSRSPLIKYYYTDQENKFGSMRNTYDSEITMYETIKDKDMIKVIIEDNIPYVEFLNTEAILADNTYAILHSSDNNNTYYSSIIAAQDTEVSPSNYAHIDNSEEIPTPNPILSGVIGIVLKEENDTQYQMNLTISGEENSACYLYYSGTAPSKPTISFSLKPKISDAGTPYIICPYNTYAKSSNDENGKAYNTLTIDESEMRFTLPSIWLGYNQALAIVEGFTESVGAIEELRAALIAGVNEYYARAWAIHSLEKANQGNTTGVIQSGFKAAFNTEMQKFINWDIAATFTFDSKKGETIAEISIQEVDETEGSFTPIEKMAGDMLRSDYIQIVKRNYPNAKNYITKDECIRISTDYPKSADGLTNFSVNFKNMYY